MSVTPKYLGNVLESFSAGVQLDLRVKLAIEFLKAPWVLTSMVQDVSIKDDPQACAVFAAGFALDLSTALLAEAATRGLVHELPDTAELSAPMRRHVERSVRANVHGQMITARVMREEGPVVQQVAPGGGAVQ